MPILSAPAAFALMNPARIALFSKVLLHQFTTHDFICGSLQKQTSQVGGIGGLAKSLGQIGRKLEKLSDNNLPWRG